ncbi:7-carboxy-7-deazaguanine synthase QueE [Hydrogenimonas sp.]
MDHASLYLVEDFFSIQGEGRHVGVPSIFLRFGGCNLRCPGFGTHEIDGERVEGCDTLRAVDVKRFKKSWHRYQRATELIAIVRAYVENAGYRPHVVLTGGEPMIYHDHPAFYGLVGWLVREGFVVTIETNATIAPDFDRYRAYGGVTFAMAVKLSNSGERVGKRVVHSAIMALASRGKDSFFKFTLDPRCDTNADEIAEIVEGYPNEIYCMPLGENGEELAANAPAVAEFCLHHGYRYSDRLHVRLWNRQERR